LPYRHPAYRKARHLKVSTLSGPAPVGWREIQAHSGRTPRDTVTLPPGGGIVSPENEFALLLDYSVVLFEDHSVWYAPPGKRPTLLDSNPKTVGIAKSEVGHAYQMQDDKSIYRYVGRPGWQRISEPSKAVAVTVADDDVYRMVSSGVVEKYNLWSNKWEAIDQMWGMVQPLLDTAPKNIGFCAQAGGYVWMMHANGHLFRGGPGKALVLHGATSIRQISCFGKDVYRLLKNGVIDKFIEPASWVTIDSNPKNIGIFAGSRLLQVRSDGSMSAFDSSTNSTIPISEGDIRAGVAQYSAELKSKFDHSVDQFFKTTINYLASAPVQALGGATLACAPCAEAALLGMQPTPSQFIICVGAITLATAIVVQTYVVKKESLNGQLPQTTPRPFEGHDTKGDPAHGTPRPTGTVTVICTDDKGEEHECD